MPRDSSHVSVLSLGMEQEVGVPKPSSNLKYNKKPADSGLRHLIELHSSHHWGGDRYIYARNTPCASSDMEGT